MKYCENCGQGNPDDATFCAQCGGSLEAQVAAGETAAGASPVPDAPTGGPGQPPPPPGAPGESLTGAPSGFGQPAGQMPFGPPPNTPPPPAYSAPMARTETEPMAIASLVLSIGGWMFCPFLFSILGVIFGYMARTKIRESGGRLQGDGIALAGIIIGWIGVGIVVAVVILFMILLAVGAFETSSYSLNQLILLAA
ncbi:MAG: DUF4190 domain-containing protein [Actinobacteria bacterium]|nr:DUF4190 domain-containing protein [Actinomycetota bacterium]